MKIQFKKGFRCSIPVEVVSDELHRILQQKGLTSHNVLEEASSPKNPLHSYFEWDDTKAAKKYRLQQAGELIRHVEVIVNDAPVRIFHNVDIECSPLKKQYVTIEDVQKSEDYASQIKRKAFNELIGWYNKYCTISELSGTIKRVELIIHQEAKKSA